MNELKVGHLFEWKNKNVVITGTDAPVGSTLAHAFAFYGANIVLFAKSKAAVHNLSCIIRGMGNDCSVYSVDLADETQVQSAVTEIRDALGQIDVLINATNELNETALITYIVGQVMMDQGYGKIILTSPFHSQLSDENNQASRSTAATVTALAEEYAAGGVNVNGVRRDNQETVTSVPDAIKPADLVGICLFLASPAANSVTGQTIHVNKPDHSV